MRAPPSTLPNAQLAESSPNFEGVMPPHTCQNYRPADDPHGGLCVHGDIQGVDDLFEKEGDLDVQ